MAKAEIRKPSILDVFLSIMVDPRGTTKQLFNYSGNPQWVMSTLLLFAAVWIVAPLMYQPHNSGEPPLAKQLQPVLFTTATTVLVATFFVTMGLRSLGIRKPWYFPLAALVYATAPLSSAMMTLLVANKVLTGELTIISFLATGFAAPGDVCSQALPYILRVAAVVSLIVLSHAVCAFSRSSLSVGALIALTCIPLILGSFIVALTATDAIMPGSSTIVIAFFRAYLAYPA